MTEAFANGSRDFQTNVMSARVLQPVNKQQQARMGIKGLLPLLKSIQRPVHVKSYSGKKIGVDAYVLLHRGCISCAWDLVHDRPTRRYVEYSMHRIRMLRHYGVIPYVVFDGDYLPSKKGTEEERSARRQESRKIGLRCLASGDSKAALDYFQKAIDVTPLMARHFIEQLRREKFEYIVAPYEADAQLAFLEEQGVIEAILTEDSDLLAFGCHRLLTKMDQYGECIEINRDLFNQVTEINLSHWGAEEFLWMAILSGCDYLPSVHGMGLKKAYALIRKYKTIERVIQIIRLDKSYQMPPNYGVRFLQAQLTFLHQRVFCPTREMLVMRRDPLIPLDQEADYFIGPSYSTALALSISQGDVDPISKMPFSPDEVCIRTPQPRVPTKAITAFFKPISNTPKEMGAPLRDITNSSLLMGASIASRTLSSTPTSKRVKLSPPEDKNATLTKSAYFTSTSNENVKRGRSYPEKENENPADSRKEKITPPQERLHQIFQSPVHTESMTRKPEIVKKFEHDHRLHDSPKRSSAILVAAGLRSKYSFIQPSHSEASQSATSTCKGTSTYTAKYAGE